MRKRTSAFLAFFTLTAITAGSASADQTGYIFLSTPQRTYNYVPSVTYGSDGIEKFWWCSGIPYDSIAYMAVNASSGQQTTAPTTALLPGPGETWDKNLVCDPSVIRGVWTNPIGNGVTYGYAMYYTGYSESVGISGVGVAFSNNGINWDKFPYPVLQNADSFPKGAYGFGEQTVFSADGQQGVWMFVVNSSITQHLDIVQLYYANDGLHFQLQVPQLSTKGLIATSGDGNFSEPMFVYSRSNGKLYLINTRTNDQPTAADMDLYSINWNEMNSGTWQLLASLGSNSANNPTGNAVNANAAIMTDEFGGYLFPGSSFMQIVFSTGQYQPPGSTVYTSLYWWQPSLPPQ